MFKNKGIEFLSEVVAQRTYVRRDEVSFDDALWRYILNIPPIIREKTEKLLLSRKIVPSMRMLAFFPYGRHEMYYNCSYLTIDSFESFGEVLYLLSCGVGVGFSVERAAIRHVPKIPKGYAAKLTIGDCREAWADSIVALLKNPDITFDYGLIRPAKSPLSCGGTASGPEPLRVAHEKIRQIVKRNVGQKLSSIDIFDICCHIADAIVVGGVRRSAMIALFDADDEAMLTAKSGQWWHDNPQRARANISAVLPNNISFVNFRNHIARGLQNGGEPAYFFRLNKDGELDGLNPCGEVGLRPRQFCNLTEVIASNIESYEELLDAVEGAVVLGTYQASLTDFGDYLPTKWKDNCEADRLLGVSFTGIAQSILPELSMAEYDEIVNLAWDVNKRYAKILGIAPAKRILSIKPSGTTSAVYGCSSGIHLPYAYRYIRRVRLEQEYMIKACIDIFGEPKPYDPNSFSPLEIDVFNPEGVVLCVPIDMPSTCGYAVAPDALDNQLALLDKMKYLITEGSSTTILNGISCTIHATEADINKIAGFLYERRFSALNRCTVFPSTPNLDSIPQLPYQAKTKYNAEMFDKFEDKYGELYDVELLKQKIAKYKFNDSSCTTPHYYSMACSGNSCELI